VSHLLVILLLIAAPVSYAQKMFFVVGVNGVF